MKSLESTEHNDALQTFWIGDLPPAFAESLLNRVIRGTCWSVDGVSGEKKLPALLKSLYRLKMGFPAKAGDRLLRVVGGVIEFHICMEDERDGQMKVKHWSGNGRGDGWRTPPREVEASSFTECLLGDLQIVTLALSGMIDLASNQRITLDEQGERMMRGWGDICAGISRLYEGLEIDGIDQIVSGLEAYLVYTSGDELYLGRMADAATINGQDWDSGAAFSYLTARHAMHMAKAHFTRELLIRYKDRLNRGLTESDTSNTEIIVRADKCRKGLSKSLR